jgi:exonuclease SbcD
MKILHTSDWHLGRTLYGRKRYEEYEEFFKWLIAIISEKEVDVLLVAGDIFDTTTPSNKAQQLYYRFLFQLSKSFCRHVVITGGNHDSPSFLNAPKELLKVLNVHVVGSVTSNLEDEVIILKNKDLEPELIVCAVPYLRDKDVRLSTAGESIEDKQQNLIDGIQNHYNEVASIAKQLKLNIPIIGMGHLFTSGGKTIDGDGVRELYIGNLAHYSASMFPTSFDYLALGHLHIPQKVGKSEVKRYSGSPIPMGFGEANQTKKTILVDITNSKVEIEEIDVPLFQKLKSVKGNWETINKEISSLLVSDSNIWIEVIYEGDEVVGDLREQLEQLVENSKIEILRIKNNLVIDQVMKQTKEEENLSDLDINQVFERLLDEKDIVDEKQREELNLTYHQIVTSVYESDALAE